MATVNPVNDKNLPLPDQLLHEAILNRKIDAVEKALARGARANGFHEDGTPLLEAARVESIEIAALLQAAGANIAMTEQLSKNRQKEIAESYQEGDSTQKSWEETLSYLDPINWLHKNSQEIGIRAIGIVARDLTQKVADLDRRYAVLEQILNPPAIEKSKLAAPKANIEP